MNLSLWAIRQPIPAIVLFILLTLVGLYGLRRLGIQELPDLDLPAVVVTATLAGAAPSQLESEVTRKIENAIATVGNIDHIISTVTDGRSITTVAFELEKDGAEALNDVRDTVARIRSDLPADLDEPVITKVNTAFGALQTFAVASDRLDEEALSWFVDHAVARAVLTVPGVGAVTRVGGVEREVRIELDPVQMTALGLSPVEVSRQIKRVQQDVSSGTAEVGGARQSLRTLAAVNRAAELGALDIVLADGRHVRLDRIATITDGVAERTQRALLDGRPVVSFQIQRARGSSAVAVAAGVNSAVERLNAQNPLLHIRLITDTVQNIQEQYDGSMHMLYEGALLAVLVVWLFLRDWRATLVAASALPLSAIPTFAVMYWLGFSLNIVTLLALTLVIGILVDDAIVEIENIVRHLRQGKPPREAAIEAATEIGLAVVATTLTLVAVFLPTAFMGGVPGLIFKQFGWTAAVAVLASLLVARLLTPMMAAWLLRPQPSGQPPDGLLMRGYLRLAAAALRYRHLTLLAGIGFFVGSLALIPLLPKGFIPAHDRAQTQVQVELAPGSSLEDTQRMAAQAEALARQLPEVRQVYTAIGAAGFSGFGKSEKAGEVRKANLTLKLAPRGERDQSQIAIENELRRALQALPGIRVTVGSGDTGEKLQLVLSGDDALALEKAARAVERELRSLPGLGNVSSSASLLRPEIQVTPDFARAAELGVTAAAIGETLRVATTGDYPVLLAKLNLPERQIDIRVRLPPGMRQDLSRLQQLRVPGPRALVPLASVSEMRLGSGPAQIERFDRRRNVTIEVELGGRLLGDVAQEVATLTSLRNLPAGVQKQDTGDAERMAELFGGFGAAMLTGVLCVYLVLVLLFKDFLQPITILAALPLSVGGAFALLLLTGYSFSMPALIGLLMLMGIATKNSILLVDYALVAMQEHGMTQTDALLDACRKRAQPIIMTTLAMSAGMLPVALGLGADASFRAPMAVAVLGGLFTSTVLSLVLVPVVFTYIASIQRRFQRRRWST